MSNRSSLKCWTQSGRDHSLALGYGHVLLTKLPRITDQAATSIPTILILWCHLGQLPRARLWSPKDFVPLLSYKQEQLEQTEKRQSCSTKENFRKELPRQSKDLIWNWMHAAQRSLSRKHKASEQTPAVIKRATKTYQRNMFSILMPSRATKSTSKSSERLTKFLNVWKPSLVTSYQPERTLVLQPLAAHTKEQDREERAKLSGSVYGQSRTEAQGNKLVIKTLQTSQESGKLVIPG